MAVAGLTTSLATGAAFAQATKATEKLTIIKGVTGQKLDKLGEGGKEVFFKEFSTIEAADAPLTCGLFRIDKGEPSSNKFDFAVVKFIVDGSIKISEASTKTDVVATKGDVVVITKGADITFATENSGTAFFCNQRAPFH